MVTSATLRRWSPWLIFLAVLVLELAAYLPLSQALNGLHDIDEAVYYSSARAWLTGYRPYVDFVYTQPPLSLLMVMPAVLVDFLTGRQDLGFIAGRMLSSLTLAATVALAWRLFRDRFESPVAGLIAIVLVMLDAITNVVGHYIMLEPFLNLLTLLVLLAALNGRLVLAALIAVAAVLTKSQGVIACVPLLAVLAVSKDWRGLAKVALVGLLGAGVPLVVGSWLTSGELFQQAVLFQFVRPAEHSLSDQGGLAGWLMLPSTRILALAGLLGLFRIRQAIRRDRAAAVAVLAWLVASVVLVTRSYSYYYHYWAQIALPLGLTAGFLLLDPLGPVARYARATVAGLMALALTTIRSPWAQSRFSVDPENGLLRAHSMEMASAGFDPTDWANIVLSKPLPDVRGKLAIDGYGTMQYLELRPFTIAHVWAGYDWDSFARQLMTASAWVWTDERGERLLLPDQQQLRESFFGDSFESGEYLLYDSPLAETAPQDRE